MTAGRKAAVAAAFGAASASYDDAAAPQRLVAAALAGQIATLVLPRRPRVLEIGCGTGGLSRLIAPSVDPARFVLSDLSPSMVAACRSALGPARGRQFMVMDGERPGFAAGSFDLICSSLAFQWFEDLPGAIARLAGLLAPGGHLAFATLGAESFGAWRAAHDAAGLEVGLPSYPTAAELRSLGFVVTEQRFAFDYPDGRRFLDAWRQIGATAPIAGRRPLSAGALRRLLRRFDDGATAVYHVLYGVVTRD